jgi:hypothetical protein
VINSWESIFPALISLAIFPNPTGCQRNHRSKLSKECTEEQRPLTIYLQEGLKSIAMFM